MAEHHVGLPTELPGSRWRSAPTPAVRGAADRVRVSHAQTRTTVRFALAFIAAAALAAAAGSARWLPLHLFLAGGVVLAISGVSLMLTVTWSAASAAPDRWVGLQRALIAAGAAGVAVARQADLPDIVLITAGGAYLVGLVLLAGRLVATVRRGVERRFDVAVAAYLVALAAGCTGVAFGVWMAAGTPPPGLRGAHVAINLLGLVGIVVGGTMPFFAATVGRSRMAPHATPRRLALTLACQASALAVAVVGLTADAPLLAGVGLGGYGACIGAVLSSLPRPTRRQLRWAGPRLLALWAGGTWWAVAVAATAADAVAERSVFGGRWLIVLVVAGYAQILWGSLAYLVPMLRGGGPERLSQGFASTRSWLAFAAANTVGLSAAASLPGALTAAAITVWLLDGGRRVARLSATRAARTPERTPWRVNRPCP